MSKNIFQKIADALFGWSGEEDVSPLPPPSPEKPAPEFLIPPDGEGAPLTPGETALVRGFFGAAFNAAAVRKHLVDEKRVEAAATFDEKIVAFYGRHHYADDYSRTDDGYKFGLFMHEMTHIFQAQAGRYWDGVQNYSYGLARGRRFEDYSTEQQASLVEDYARRFLCDPPLPSRQAIERGRIRDNSATDALLKEIVEDHFPAAKNLRLSGVARSVRRTEAPSIWYVRRALPV